MSYDNPAADIMINNLCESCKDWGKTVAEEPGWTIPCSSCGRHTWPNLGVNCPAGMAVAFGARNAGFDQNR